jgi:Transposase DDE domain
MVDSRTRRATVESGSRAGVDGHQHVRGSTGHAVVDTMGTLLALLALLALAVTRATAAERRQLSALAQRVQEVRGAAVEVLYADAASTGEETAVAAQEQGMRFVVQRPPGQPRLCPAPQEVGSRAQLRVGQSLPPPGA